MATQENRAMQSEVAICNQALSWLSANPITSLDDHSKNAELCRNNYAMVRDAVLEERMWTFATVRDTSETANLDAWGKMYKHPMPLEWLQCFRAYRDVSSQDPACWIQSEGWRLEDGYILSNDSSLYLWGVKRIEDTAKFSNLFAQAVAARMAAVLAGPITGKESYRVNNWKLYQAFLSDAAARDGQQGTNEQIRSSSLVDARGRY